VQRHRCGGRRQIVAVAAPGSGRRHKLGEPEIEHLDLPGRRHHDVGAYELPWAITVSANAQHFTGFPEEDTVIVGSNTVALTQVSQSIVSQPRGTNRLPDVNAFDMAVRKRLKLRTGITAEPALELFNLGNANTVQGRITTLGPAYYRASSVMRGRMLRVGVNVKF
jgi:hypothetical protein